MAITHTLSDIISDNRQKSKSQVRFLHIVRRGAHLFLKRKVKRNRDALVPPFCPIAPRDLYFAGKAGRIEAKLPARRRRLYGLHRGDRRGEHGHPRAQRQAADHAGFQPGHTAYVAGRRLPQHLRESGAAGRGRAAGDGRRRRRARAQHPVGLRAGRHRHERHARRAGRALLELYLHHGQQRRHAAGDERHAHHQEARRAAGR